MSELNKEEFVIGFDNISDPSVMIITIPIKKFAEDQRGTVYLRGHMEEAKLFALNRIVSIREARKNQLFPPMPVNGKSHEVII